MKLIAKRWIDGVLVQPNFERPITLNDAVSFVIEFESNSIFHHMPGVGFSFSSRLLNMNDSIIFVGDDAENEEFGAFLDAMRHYGYFRTNGPGLLNPRAKVSVAMYDQMPRVPIPFQIFVPVLVWAGISTFPGQKLFEEYLVLGNNERAAFKADLLASIFLAKETGNTDDFTNIVDLMLAKPTYNSAGMIDGLK
jgi:hypothetical protein